MQLAQTEQPTMRKALATPKKAIQIPNGWATRPYQKDLWEHMAGGGLRACAAWHRPAGRIPRPLGHGLINWCCEWRCPLYPAKQTILRAGAKVR